MPEFSVVGGMEIIMELLMPRSRWMKWVEVAGQITAEQNHFLSKILYRKSKIRVKFDGKGNVPSEGTNRNQILD